MGDGLLFHQTDEGSAQADQHMGSHACRPVFHFPLNADNGSEDDRGHDSENHLPESERLSKSYPVKNHNIPPVASKQDIQTD